MARETEMLAEAVAAVAGTDRAAWSSPARSAEVVELLAARERLDAVIIDVVGSWEAAGDWAVDGARSPVAWLAHHAALTREAAATLTRTARHVRAHGATAAALRTGAITAGHVDLVARAARHREDFYGEHEATLLETAEELAPAAFRTVAQHWARCVDAVAGREPPSDAVRDNYLDASPTFGGVGHLEGRLDPVSFQALVDRLDALEPPDATDGRRAPRSRAQRRAAALMRLVHGDGPRRAARIDVLVDVDTLAGRPAPDLVSGCCELRGFGPVSPDLARTLACDAAIGRVLVRGASEVLDVGRRSRLVTPALRRMLEIRDRTCTEAGCDVPAAWCDAHHIVPWWAHGPTAATNLRLRCRFHHLLDHRRTARARGDPDHRRPATS